jgi:hypothetical protein
MANFPKLVGSSNTIRINDIARRPFRRLRVGSGRALSSPMAGVRWSDLIGPDESRPYRDERSIPAVRSSTGKNLFDPMPGFSAEFPLSPFAVTLSPFASLMVNSAKGRQWVRGWDRTADSLRSLR